jgi:integrase
MDGVVLPTQKRVQRFFLSDAEIRSILSAAPEPYRTFYGLLAETGLRVGELCGLTVEDVDLERGILQVRQSAWRGKLGDPKTDESTRVVELSPRACENLKVHLDRWHPNERRLVFASKNGTPWDQNTSQAPVPATAQITRNLRAARKWLPRLPSRERNAHVPLRSATETAAATARTRGWFSRDGDHLHARCQRRRAPRRRNAG